MIKTIELPFYTSFSYDTESQYLFPLSLCGMSCLRNSDFNAAGTAVICVNNEKLEGRKLKYEIITANDQEFIFNAADPDKKVLLENHWHFHQEYNIISCNFTLSNTSDKEIVVRRALPRWTFAPGHWKVYHHLSRWCAENQLQCSDLAGADLHLHGLSTRSSVQNTPYCILQDTVNNTATAFHVLPAGNWQIKIHSVCWVNELPIPVVEAGLSDEDLFMTLAPGESIQLPEVLIQQAAAGDILSLSAPLHRYMNRERIPAALKTPPVLYNSWLYRFESFTEEQLLEQAEAAKEIGCDLFVVDAGWFGCAEGWGAVGDWREKPGKPFYGNMAAFADKIRAMGLKFGFWMEPERWVPGIPIREEHPEWFPAHTTRIDLTNPEAAEYIKLDFNDHTGYDDSGCEMYHYAKVSNGMIERLHKDFPKLVVENCASGGLRNDLSKTMLYDHFFISDNAHPWETVRIKQGLFMRNLPGRTLSWAVVRPAQERLTPHTPGHKIMACTGASWESAGLFDLDYVAVSALLGIPAFSGDLAGLDQTCKTAFAKAISFYKENREFFVKSVVHLLTPPPSAITDYEEIAVMQMQDLEKTDSLVFAFTHGCARISFRNFRLKELNPDCKYHVKSIFGVKEANYVVSGKELMECGIRFEVPDMHIQPYSAALYQVTPLQ